MDIDGISLPRHIGKPLRSEVAVYKLGNVLASYREILVFDEDMIDGNCLHDKAEIHDDGHCHGMRGRLRFQAIFWAWHYHDLSNLEIGGDDSNCVLLSKKTKDGGVVHHLIALEMHTFSLLLWIVPNFLNFQRLLEKVYSS